MLTEINYLAVLVSTIAAFIASSAYYSIVGTQSGEPVKPWQIPVELLRSATVALVIAGLITRLDLGFGGALGLALVLWLGFPAVLLSGSMLWDKVSWRIAVSHAGDWLLKLLLFAIILSLWQ
ncbi:DUF1761 domain-containing protein [Amycolatopsis sp. 195334CR]|uniref:DUF1761 domain-containing protein n=1 Tax=Amycolatopsis sp. 195334CR TaxID=2814588 RepID=UPI001A8F77FF|nr:DUF1761 domain-containing protein [Amycolatopsis sp. 195334CR]MBN6039920.1 DUF1761 domain-containing protein [Amycolatopsis sp. 195334CR]